MSAFGTLRGGVFPEMTGMLGELERYCADLGGTPWGLPRWPCSSSGAVAVRRMAPLTLEDPMTNSKSRKPDTSKHARPKPKHGKRKESGTRKAAPCKVMRPLRATGSASVADSGKSQPDTKQAQVIAMLCAPSGATIDAMMRMTGWQQHSVRGFLTAVVRKKLGLDLRSEATESGRLYRINDRGVSDTKAKHAA
jgi:hypothetical protein